MGTAIARNFSLLDIIRTALEEGSIMRRAIAERRASRSSCRSSSSVGIELASMEAGSAAEKKHSRGRAISFLKGEGRRSIFWAGAYMSLSVFLELNARFSSPISFLGAFFLLVSFEFFLFFDRVLDLLVEVFDLPQHTE